MFSFGKEIDCLTFTSVGESTISLKKQNTPHKIWLKFKLGDSNWQPYEIGKDITLSDGDTVAFKTTLNNIRFNAANDYYYFVMTGEIRATGSIMSLIRTSQTADKLPDMCFSKLFQSCKSLVSAPELPSVNLGKSCYSHMFSDCTGLISSPALPATVMAESCYEAMFQRCYGLVSAPELPAKNLAKRCYAYMFFGCTGLQSLPELPAMKMEAGCYSAMFLGCDSIVKAPELPALILDNACYQGMFSFCKGLTVTPELPAVILAENCYSYMFSGCKSLSSPPALPATKMAEGCYDRMFENCTCLERLPEFSVTLEDHSFPDMFSGCENLELPPAFQELEAKPTSISEVDEAPDDTKQSFKPTDRKYSMSKGSKEPRIDKKAVDSFLNELLIYGNLNQNPSITDFIGTWKEDRVDGTYQITETQFSLVYPDSKIAYTTTWKLTDQCVLEVDDHGRVYDKFMVTTNGNCLVHIDADNSIHLHYIVRNQ